MIQMIATDMDGTLLDSKGRLDIPRLTAVLDELEKRGVPFVVATGNDMPRMKWLFGDLVKRIQFVAANGAHVLVDGQTIGGHYWDDFLLKEVLDYFQGKELDYHLVISTAKGNITMKGNTFPLLKQLMDDEMHTAFLEQMIFLPEFSLETIQQVRR